MQTDYIIVGQGICGTLLSHNLIKAGKKVMVIDEGSSSASRVASGVINPITGKRLVSTWLINELLPFAWSTYKALEQELGIGLIRECDIIDFHTSPDNAGIFNSKAETEPCLEADIDTKNLSPWFHFNYGAGKISPCLLVDMQALLNEWRKILQKQNMLMEGKVDYDEIKYPTEHVIYKDIVATKIIFCEGANADENPYFEKLPWSKDKGEALIADIPGLSPTSIYKQEMMIVPWQGNLFWVGATHDWRYDNLERTEAFSIKTEEQLRRWLKVPFNIVDHLVGRRPANFERRPFVGLHPQMPQVGILNGMGSKGCSLAPYFATQMANHLVNNSPLMVEVDINRYGKLLNR